MPVKVRRNPKLYAATRHADGRELSDESAVSMDGNPSCSPSSQRVAQPTIAVLSLDGGGLKGLLTLQMLKELERRTGKRIRELFQVIAGTSTGGILALAIQEGVPLEFIERLYLLLGQG